jgi:hypothetical protein
VDTSGYMMGKTLKCIDQPSQFCGEIWGAPSTWPNEEVDGGQPEDPGVDEVDMPQMDYGHSLE